MCALALVSACGRLGFGSHGLTDGGAVDLEDPTDAKLDAISPPDGTLSDLGGDSNAEADAGDDLGMVDSGISVDAAESDASDEDLGVVDASVSDAGMDAAGEDAGDDAGDDAGEDAGEPDMGPVGIAEECLHKWVTTTDINSNFHMTAGPAGVVLGGIDNAFAQRTQCLDQADGSIVWTAPGVGGVGGQVNSAGFGHNNTDLWTMSGIGSGANMRVINISTGVLGPAVNYDFMTWGLGNAVSMGVRDDGEALVQLADIPAMAGTGTPVSEWIGSFQGSAFFMEPGPGLIYVRHDATGAYVDHLNVEGAEYQPARPVARASGGYSFVVSARASGATVDGHVIAPGMTELIAVDGSLNYVGAFTLPYLDTHEITSPPGSDIRVVSDANHRSVLRAFDDGGMIWSHDECAGEYIASDAYYIHVVRVIYGTTSYCGQTIAGGSGAIGYARIRATTGDIEAVQWFGSNAMPLGGLAVDTMGGAYVALQHDGVTPHTLCGDAVATTGLQGFAIYALVPF